LNFFEQTLIENYQARFDFKIFFAILIAIEKPIQINHDPV